jgi:sugar lactone lactonase YvrE
MGEAAARPRFHRTLRISGKGPGSGKFREELRGIAVDDDGRLYAVGDSTVKIFDRDGGLLREWKSGQPGHSVAVDIDGRVWVGEWRQVEIFEPQGELAQSWTDSGRLGLVTAIGLGSDDVFLADATARCIRRYDREGRFVNDIGDRHRRGGFNIPNGVVDFALDGAGVLHVAHPGMHRVERYDAAGELLGRFGRFDGVDPEGFGGCCNPTNLAVDRSGRVVVSEKAGPRVKLYDRDGRLLAVVADEGFDPSAKNMDLAIDPAGRIYVADTAKLEIHVFSPESAGGGG